MKKLIPISTSILSLALLLSSCVGDYHCIKADHSTRSETRDLADFDRVSLNISGNLTIHIEDSIDPYIEIEGSSPLVSNLETKVRNNKLIIEYDRCVSRSEDLELTLYTSYVDELQLNGSGTIYSYNTLKANEIDLSISGSGDMDLSVDADRVITDISGSGDVDLFGDAPHQVISISGSGSYNSFDVNSKYGKVDIAGSGDVKVNVDSLLDVKISGSGDVFYLGSPEVKSNISGSGSVNQYD